MVDMNTLIDLQITIFLMMLAGYVLTKLKVLAVDARKTLSSLLINFIIPCNIIVAFMREFNMQILMSGLAILLISIGIQFVTAVFGKYLYPNTEEKQLAVLRYGTVVSNAGYMGNPIAYGLFGTEGLLFASIYLIPQRIVLWSAGITYFTGIKGKNVIKKIFTHPCIVAVYIGLFLMIAQISLPSGLVKTLTYGSNCVTAISMIIVGNILADIKIKSVVSIKALWYCFVRLILIPGLVLVVCRLAGVSTFITTLSVLLAGMPAGATTAILAAQYEGDDQFAAKIILLSTILSLFTIPILVVASGMV